MTKALGTEKNPEDQVLIVDSVNLREVLLISLNITSKILFLGYFAEMVVPA